MHRELNPSRCQRRVYGVRDVRGYQCQNKPIVTRDGKLFCRIHDPEYIRAKEAKRKAQWDKEWLALQGRNDLERARKEATKGLTIQELRRVTPDLIRQALAHTEEARRW